VQRGADPCFATPTFELGRNDPRVVEHQNVAWTQDLRKVEDLPIREPLILHHQHARGIARASRA
jgi:hypothetical protein